MLGQCHQGGQLLSLLGPKANLLESNTLGVCKSNPSCVDPARADTLSVCVEIPRIPKPQMVAWLCGLLLIFALTFLTLFIFHLQKGSVRRRYPSKGISSSPVKRFLHSRKNKHIRPNFL